MKKKGLLKLIIPISLVAVLAVGLPLMSGCRPAPEVAPPEVAPPEVTPPEVVEPLPETIKVGFLAALSGPLAAVGEEMVMGAELAEKEINEAGGILGRPLELIIKDTKAYVDEHPVELVDELVLKDEVLFISGALSDSIGWPVRERCVYRDVPYLGQAPTDSMVSRGENLHPWMFITIPDNEIMHWCIWPYLFSNDLVPKDVVTIGPDYEWGWSCAKVAKKPIEQFGGTVVADIFTPVPTIKFDTFVAQIQDLMPEGGTIVDNHGGGEMLEMFHEVYAAGLLDKGYAFVKNQLYGPSTYGALSQAEKEGVWAIDICYPYIPDDQIHQEWVERFFAEYGWLPSGLHLHPYVTLHAAAEAINTTGSLDPDVWIPEIKGEVKTGLVTDGEYMFQDLTGRLLWPQTLLRGKAPEDMVDIFPTMPEVGAEWDQWEIIYTFDLEYQLAVIPEEAILEGVDYGGPGIGDGILHYWK